MDNHLDLPESPGLAVTGYANNTDTPIPEDLQALCPDAIAVACFGPPMSGVLASIPLEMIETMLSVDPMFVERHGRIERIVQDDVCHVFVMAD